LAFELLEEDVTVARHRDSPVATIVHLGGFGALSWTSV